MIRHECYRSIREGERRGAAEQELCALDHAQRVGVEQLAAQRVQRRQVRSTHTTQGRREGSFGGGGTPVLLLALLVGCAALERGGEASLHVGVHCVKTRTRHGHTYYSHTYYGPTYYLHVGVELREDAALLDVGSHEQLSTRHVADEEAIELVGRASPWEVACDGRLRAAGVEGLLWLHDCGHAYYGCTYYGCTYCDSTHYGRLHVGVEMLSEVKRRLVVSVSLDQRKL